MVGLRIREKRQSQQRSLADIATEAGISVATLSRIENEKQTLDLGLFLVIARVLKISPHDLLDKDGNGAEDEADPLVRQISTLAARDRTQLWRDLAAEKRILRSRNRRQDDAQFGAQVEELLAQLDFLREELEAMRRRVRRR